MYVESHNVFRCVPLISERKDVVVLKQYRKETPQKCLNVSSDSHTIYRLDRPEISLKENSENLIEEIKLLVK